MSKRPVFISCSWLGPNWRQLPPEVRDNCLLFFGSKRSWLFPSSPAEEEDARKQPGRYHLMEREFLEFVLAKEARREVHFLKADNLEYVRYPGPPDPQAYERASAFFAAARDGAPLILDPHAWMARPKEHFAFVSGANPAQRVIANFQRGYHEYDEVCELIAFSCPRLQPRRT
eukprot:gnl/Spiro4/14357_TR7731_c0_g1_i1.p2 gnl/Spiro4/14357_TR7731_c0_g1~~gnl/Spiro4/14357_TR7731_c0_g1_i1.p2  ORF type:complete len:188 (+),score=30.62 gnl/Spiro4/14357_TR7731_c0_g1_i1:46-564(+)